MAILSIVKEPDPLLRKTSRPVEEITPRIKTLLDDMVDTMHKANGCGLAGVQVGVLRRVVVIECTEGEIYKLINPKIISWSGVQEEAEGCLSLPNKWGRTRRPAKVVARALNPEGEEIEIRGEGLLARCLCHEIDHLDGKLFTDCQIEELEIDE